MQCGGGRQFFTCLAPWGCPFPVHHHYNIYNLFISVHPAWFVFAFWLSAVFLAMQDIWKYEIWFSFVFNIIQGGQLVNQKSTKAVSDLGQAQTDWQIRLCTSLYQILCSIWSHLAFLLLNPVWQPTRFCIMYSGKRMKACVALQNGWIYPRIISLCLSTSQQCLHKHGSFKSTDRGKWVQYTKSWFGRWCLQSDGHRWGALSSADVSSNRESGSFVRDIFINCYRWDMIRFWTCQRGCYQHQWGRLCDLILVLNGISLLHACHTPVMDNVVHVSHMLQSG